MTRWLPVVGAEKKYRVSSEGDVYSYYLDRNMKPSVNDRGYYVITIRDVGVKPLHLIVLEAFKGPRPAGLIARHLDSNKLNCREDNLEWATQSQNIADNLSTRTVHTQKLTIEDVILIRSRTWTKEEQEAFCTERNILMQAFYKAQTGRTFKHIPMEV